MLRPSEITSQKGRKEKMQASKLGALFVAVASFGLIGSARAAFIVQVDTDGVNNTPTAAGTLNSHVTFGNGMTGGFSWSTAATAAGLQPGNSIFGGNAATADQYIYSYKPGTDADNATFTAGQNLGNGNAATGIIGGATGTYNVYACWPSSANISDNGATPTSYVASGDLGSATAGLNQDEDTNGALVGGVWALIGTVQLTAGNTYTVTQTAPNSSFVSQRAVAVMWEAATVAPEPASLSLLALGGLSMVRRRRHRR
jgi:hypothetical protein